MARASSVHQFDPGVISSLIGCDGYSLFVRSWYERIKVRYLAQIIDRPTSLALVMLHIVILC